MISWRVGGNRSRRVEIVYGGCVLGCADHHHIGTAGYELAYSLSSTVVSKKDGVLEHSFCVLHVLGLQQHTNPLLDSLQYQTQMCQHRCLLSVPCACSLVAFDSLPGSAGFQA